MDWNLPLDYHMLETLQVLLLQRLRTFRRLIHSGYHCLPNDRVNVERLLLEANYPLMDKLSEVVMVVELSWYLDLKLILDEVHEGCDRDGVRTLAYIRVKLGQAHSTYLLDDFCEEQDLLVHFRIMNFLHIVLVDHPFKSLRFE